jgi:biopolymer transport protein ExbD
MPMNRSATFEEPRTFIEINTTPLIDVMLVLLIMFIITIPLQTHAVKLDLPSGPNTERLIHHTRNQVAITAAGAILWNGEPVSKAELSAILERAQALRPVPELHLQPEPEARYDLVDEVLAITKRAQVERMGFVGNERYASF